MVGQRVAPDGCKLNMAELECLDSLVQRHGGRKSNLQSMRTKMLRYIIALLYLLTK